MPIRPFVHLSRLAITTVLIAAILPSPRIDAAAANDQSITDLLAIEFERQLRAIMQQPALPLESVAVVEAVMEEILNLTPDDLDAWRLALQIATFTENDDLQDRAIQAILRLDPADEVVQLLRVNQFIEQRQTAPERIAAYEALLSPANRTRLSPAIASRLATDLALLHRRSGETQAFARWISEAITIDPANRIAGAIAAGYFRLHGSDALGEAELLTSALLADPADYDLMLVLGQHLLDHGAYRGAARIYDLAIRGKTATGFEATAGIHADRALAFWGAGEIDAALEAIRNVQRGVDNQAKRMALEEQSARSLLDVADVTGDLPPVLGALRLAILRERGDDTAAQNSWQALNHAYDNIVANYETQAAEQSAAPDAAEIAPDVARRFMELRLEHAFMALWLGRDVPVAQASLAALPDDALSDAAQARFDAWIALREGRLDDAITGFMPLAETDTTARLGLAHALLETGRTREAAEHLLTVATEQPGTLIAIWAANRLTGILRNRVNITTTARQMNALIDDINPEVDRYPDDPSRAVNLRVTPLKSEYDPFEPLLVRIELINNAPFPLAIDRDGPIRNQIILEPTIRVANVRTPTNVDPMVIDIGRRLRLQPRERITVIVDLRRYVPARHLTNFPVVGGFIALRAVSNALISGSGVLSPAMLGTEADTLPVRLNGARVDDAWLQRALHAAESPVDASDVQQIALLGHAVVMAHQRRRPIEFQADLESVKQAQSAVIDAFNRVDPTAQAWLMTVMPAAAQLAPIRESITPEAHRLVRVAAMLRGVTGPDDPLLAAALDSDDPTLRAIAENFRARQAAAEAAGSQP